MEDNKKIEDFICTIDTTVVARDIQEEEESSTSSSAAQQSVLTTTNTVITPSAACRQELKRKMWEHERRLEKTNLKKQAKHKRDLIVRYDCEKCGKALNAYEAFYHWSGPGPLCIKCIEEDDELSGYKWECKTEFTR